MQYNYNYDIFSLTIGQHIVYPVSFRKQYRIGISRILTKTRNKLTQTFGRLAEVQA